MEQLDASKFKEQCLSLLDHPGPDGIVITRHGKAIARMIPMESGCADLIGSSDPCGISAIGIREVRRFGTAPSQSRLRMKSRELAPRSVGHAGSQDSAVENRADGARMMARKLYWDFPLL